jgi:hypothetical protein
MGGSAWAAASVAAEAVFSASRDRPLPARAFSLLLMATILSSDPAEELGDPEGEKWSGLAEGKDEQQVR